MDKENVTTAAFGQNPLRSFPTGDAGVPRAVIRKPKLLVRKYKPSAGYMNALSKRLVRAPAVYHFERVQMRQATIAGGLQTAEWPNLVAGQLPKMMLVCLASLAALSGSHDTTPFYQDHFDGPYSNAETDGKLYPSGGYTMDFGTHQALS